MKHTNDRMDRNRDAELALKEHIEIKREAFVYELLRGMGIEEIEEDRFQYLLDKVVQFESEQLSAINAYHHEKNLNDHFFDGL